MTNMWDEFEKETGEKGVGKSKSKFNRIDFNTHQTQIRLLADNGVKRMYHFVQDGKKGKPAICCGDGCPVCATGDSPSPKWLFPALERSQLVVGIVQLPLTVVRGINDLKKQSWFGTDIKAYDILVLKTLSLDQNNKKKTTYTVQGVPKDAVPKLPEDVRTRVVEELKEIDMEKVCTPYTPEQTMKYLGWVATPAVQQVQPTASKIPVTSKLSAPVVVPPPPPDTKKGVNINKFLQEEAPEADEAYSMPSGGSEEDPSDEALEI
jgi:hypothetical protein